MKKDFEKRKKGLEKEEGGCAAQLTCLVISKRRGKRMSSQRLEDAIAEDKNPLK